MLVNVFSDLQAEVQYNTLNLFAFQQIDCSIKPTDTCFHFPVSCSEAVHNRNTWKCSGAVWGQPYSDCWMASSHVSWSQTGQCAVSGKNLCSLAVHGCLVISCHALFCTSFLILRVCIAVVRILSYLIMTVLKEFFYPFLRILCPRFSSCAYLIPQLISKWMYWR
jgi:hypothetical protein